MKGLKMLRIAVTGGRDFTNKELIERALPPGPNKDITIVHGGCRGADFLCKEVAEERGLLTEEWPADWKTYGKAAGPIRNTQMLKSGIDVLYVFPGGRGTEHCRRKAIELGIEVKDFRNSNS